MLRDSALTCIAQIAKRRDAVIFVGNGNNARALSGLVDQERNFYMVGSMSLGPSLAAGFAARSHKSVIVIEGDGNALMGLSGFPTVARAVTHKATFIHLVLDNGIFETTGGQKTLSSGVSFTDFAQGAGYHKTFAIDELGVLEHVVEESLITPRQLVFIHARTEWNTQPQHPRVPYHPREIHKRFKAFAEQAIS